MKLFYSIALALFASTAIAQDITPKLDRIGQGSYAVYKGGGQTYTHIYGGKSGAYYIYDVVPGKDPSAMEGRSRYFRDAKGQTVKWVTADGVTVTFVPHNCQRTVGRCSFVEKGISDGKPYETKMIRTTKPTKKGFSFEQLGIGPDGKEHLMMRGSVVLDEFGIAKRATVKNAEKRTKFKRVKAILE